MKRRTTILVFAASVALAACGNNNNNNPVVNNNPDTNNNNPTNNATNNASNNNNNPTNNTTTPTNNVTTPTNNMTTGPTPTCDDYCDTVMANCTAELAQYSSRDECIDYCQNVAGWDAGIADETTGNSIGCRTYHAGDPAVADAATHCPHAGPTGGNVCGTWCESYCQLALNNCTDANEIYADDAACTTACAGFDDSGNAGDTEYATVQCRIYHAGAPAATDPATHCPHAQETPTEICVGLPTDFNFATNVPSDYMRVDRMGMPAVSTALITDKDAYNDANPADDLLATFVPQIVGTIATLHTALDAQLQGLSLTPCSTNGTPTCTSQAVVNNGPAVADLIIPDTIKIDPMTAAGFPNGRRLPDQVIDVTLAVILLDLTVHTPTTLAELPLNPPENDLGVEGAFLTTFPYLHPPHQP